MENQVTLYGRGDDPLPFFMFRVSLEIPMLFLGNEKTFIHLVGMVGAEERIILA